MERIKFTIPIMVLKVKSSQGSIRALDMDAHKPEQVTDNGLDKVAQSQSIIPSRPLLISTDITTPHRGHDWALLSSVW